MTTILASRDFGVAEPRTPRPLMPKHERAPVDPDPKAHPVHRDVPAQPIRQGTDPKHPVTPPHDHR